VRVADYIMQFVASLGVKHVFVLTGGGAMHLNDALARCPDLEYVCNHHEQACAIAAESYSKATANLGVAMVTTGPGGTNAITGLAGAWLDSTPCLFFSGQVKRADRMYRPDGTPLGVRQRGIQEVDIVSVVRPLTKYAVTIEDPLSIRYHLEKAVRLARSGRPGPVWLDIPIDVQASPVEESELRGFDPPEIPHSDSTLALAGQVREIIERFSTAERPLLLVGNGVRLAGAGSAILDLVDALDIPVAATWMAMDLIGDDHPRFVGKPGTVAARGANFAAQNCDFLLSIGARLDLPLTGWSAAQFARAAHKVMVDVDPSELAKLAPFISTTVCADAALFIRELLKQCSAIKPRGRGCWLRRCEDWKSRYPVVRPEHRATGGRVSVYHLAEVIGEEIALEDQLVSGSSGSGIEIFLFAYRARLGQRVFHTAGLGAMGFAIPASIGACIGSGRKRTICVDGDGGFQLNIQELATIAHLRLPIKFFILNNDGYASIRASQASFFGQPSIGCSEATGVSLPDLRKVARAYGLGCAAIEDQRDLHTQVRRVLTMPGPVVCDVKVIPDEVRAPRVTSVQRQDGSFVSKPLEDLWPFLDRNEFEQNMLVEPVSE
jgi:acetolactate synthase I/II/III large subunit